MPNTIGTIFQEIYHLGLWCGAMSLGVMSIVRSVGNQLTLVQSIYCCRRFYQVAVLSDTLLHVSVAMHT